MGQWEKGLEDANKSLALKEDFAKSHFRKGLCLFELGRFEEAEKSFREAYDIEPENQEITQKLELVKQKLNKN